ncbi:hypothetical protein MMC30_007256 [Trapelia coarctata]|nr:hypothetical protein [Trapelia coarctata]
MLIPLGCGRDNKTAEDSMPMLSSPDDEELPASTIQRPVYSHHASPMHMSLHQVILKSWHAALQSLLTLFRTSNPTFTVVLVILINGFALNIQVLLQQYTSLVLHWSLATVNTALALKALVSSLVLFTLPTVRKAYLEPRMSTARIDLLITQASLVANLVGMIGLGFSGSAWFFVTSLCVFTSGCGLADSLTAYGTFSLPEGESVPDFYLRIGLVQTIAGLFGAPLWSTLFSLVLESRIVPLGFPFWLGAGLFGAGVIGTNALKKWCKDGI